MALNPSNSSNLEQLAVKGLTPTIIIHWSRYFGELYLVFLLSLASPVTARNVLFFAIRRHIYVIFTGPSLGPSSSQAICSPIVKTNNYFQLPHSHHEPSLYLSQLYGTHSNLTCILLTLLAHLNLSLRAHCSLQLTATSHNSSRGVSRYVFFAFWGAPTDLTCDERKWSVTWELKLFQKLFQPSSTSSRNSFISARGNLREITSKLFQKLTAARGYFPTCSSTKVQCRWNNSEIISAAEMILFQFQTWLRVEYNTEVILKLLFQNDFISHVATV